MDHIASVVWESNSIVTWLFLCVYLSVIIIISCIVYTKVTLSFGRVIGEDNVFSFMKSNYLILSMIIYNYIYI